MKKKDPRNYEHTEYFSAEWLRYEAQETQKFFVSISCVFSVFFCVFCGLKKHRGGIK